MNASDRVVKGARKGTGILLSVLALLSLAAVAEYLLGLGGVIFAITVLMVCVTGAIVIARVFLMDVMVRHPDDERVRKIKARALSFSWIATLAFVVVLRLGGPVLQWEVSKDDALTYTLFVMVYSFLGLFWYFRRKPDVELV